MSEMTKYEPTDLTQLIKYAQWMMESKLLPEHIKTPQDVVLLVQFGAGFGVPPMQAIQNLYIVEGKVTMGAHIALGLAMSHPACEYMMCTESTPEQAVWEGKRAGHPKPTTVSYTIAQAEEARLVKKSNWQKHPAEMLRARAGMHLARLLFPDMLAGVYDPDELGAVTQPHPEPTPNATTQIQRAPQGAPARADIMDAEVVTERIEPALNSPEDVGYAPPPNPGPTSAAAKQLSQDEEKEDEERQELLAQLRKWLSDAKLGRQLNVLIMEGLTRRAAGGHYEEGMPLNAVPVKLLREEIKHLKREIEKHGLATALRDVTEWAPNHIEGEGGELRGPVPSPA